MSHTIVGQAPRAVARGSKHGSADTSLQAHTACPVCGSQQAKVVATRDGKTRESLMTVQCDGCGLGRIDPMPTQDELAAYYSHDYRQAYKSAHEPHLRHVLRAARNAAQRWAWLTAQSSIVKGAKTLDIGASSGEFVYISQSQGNDAKGIEPNLGYATFGARELGVNVQQGTLDQRLPELIERFDLISLFHVLEHLPNPVQSLQAIACKLSRDGLLYIEVPNATRPCSPHYMFFRAHTLYFTAASLTSTLAAAGLQIVADNFESGEDLRVVAKSTSQEHQPVFLPSDALRAAQRNRRWGPYLLRQLARMTLIDKLKKRQAEKRLARQLGSARSIIDQAMQEHLGR